MSAKPISTKELVGKATFASKPLGETLMEAGLISASQIEIALQEQKSYNLKIGEIFALHNWIKQKTADFFVEKWDAFLQESPKRPLAYYFQEAGLLSKEQIEDIIKLQQRKQKKVRFHRLAVEQGYLKQTTVDFFCAGLFGVNNPRNYFCKDLYEILISYNEGQTNFQNTQLKRASLIGISLKGVKLDNSDFQKANLKNCNLSNSSLIKVNFTLANLIKITLSKANLEKACLTQANLQEAKLDQANFKGANLQGANLTNANLAQASFAAANLKEAKLPLEYSEQVYYDQKTIFDDSFNPQQAGWTIIN